MLNRKYTIKTTDTGRYFITDRKGELEVKDKGDIALLLKELAVLVDIIPDGESDKHEERKYFYVVAETMDKAMSLYKRFAKGQYFRRVSRPEVFYGCNNNDEIVYITESAYMSSGSNNIVRAALERGFKIEVVED